MMNNNNEELYHYGIKGQKWGIRRYQNKDGSLTSAGRKRTNDDNSNTNSKKKIAGAAVAAMAVSTAAVVYGKNPKVRKTVNNFVAKSGEQTIQYVKKNCKKTFMLGKNYINTVVTSAKDGVKEGMKEAPKKATKAIVTGIVLNASKRLMDQAVGKEETARIFKANNSKKIDSFWKVAVEDRDDD